MRMSLNIFPSIACNLIVASNKEREEHNNMYSVQYKAHDQNQMVFNEQWRVFYLDLGFVFP